MSKSATEPRLVPVGRIGRTHGIRGAVKVVPYGESLPQLEAGSTLYLKGPSPKGHLSTLTLLSLKPHGKNAWLCHFGEITNSEEAKKLAGEEVFLPEDCLSPPSEREYYYYQLIGLRVETSDGTHLGVLTGILETRSNDVYVVTLQDREILIPALEDVIRQVDLENGRMIVDPPEGLIDDL